MNVSIRPAGIRMFTVLAVITALYSIFSMLLMSDFGQFIALPKAWIITYYRFKWLFGVINIALLAALWVLHCPSLAAHFRHLRCIGVPLCGQYA